jgi:uncharacterized protein YcbX
MSCRTASSMASGTALGGVMAAIVTECCRCAATTVATTVVVVSRVFV